MTDNITQPQLRLGAGLRFEDLYETAGLNRLDAAFLAHLETANPALAEELRAARSNPAGLDRKPASELIIAIAPHVEDFIAQLFGIEQDVEKLQKEHNEHAPLYNVKRKFVQKR